MAGVLYWGLEEEDTLARLGGDEFAIITPNAPDRPALERKAAALLTALRTPFYAGSHELNVGASIGIAFCPTDGRDSSTLLQNADSAMYESKRLGRNRFSFFTADMRENAVERLRIESNLRTAIGAGRFTRSFSLSTISGRGDWFALRRCAGGATAISAMSSRRSLSRLPKKPAPSL